MSTTWTLSELTDEAMDLVYEATEHPRLVTLGTDDLANASDNQFTLQSGDENLIAVTDVVEFGDELVLVTAKSTDATPKFTCQRGYLGTTAVAHTAGTVGRKNPPWARYQAQRYIKRFFDILAPQYLPNLQVLSLTPASDKSIVEIPANVMQVYEVRYSEPNSLKIIYIDNWVFHENLPTTVSSTGKALQLPAVVTDNDTILVTVSEPWEFTGSDPSITVPDAMNGLAPLYAAAVMLTNREVGRTEVDQIEEWNDSAAIRQGVNLRLIRMIWQDFYRLLDEARRVVRVPRHRPYRPRRIV